MLRVGAAEWDSGLQTKTHQSAAQIHIMALTNVCKLDAVPASPEGEQEGRFHRSRSQALWECRGLLIAKQIQPHLLDQSLSNKNISFVFLNLTNPSNTF